MSKRLLAAVTVLLLTATPAAAHVSVSPEEVTEGSTATLTFHVPNERDDASTVKIDVAMPESAPFRSVSVQPVAGWTHDVTRAGDSVTRIAWSGGEIGPGEFVELSISVGPVPEVEKLEFPVLQTYDSGEVVRWIDPVVDGESEPEHPAPTAVVTSGDASGAHGELTVSDGGDGDGTDPLAFLALLVAGIAIVLAVAALIFGPRRVPD